MINTIELYNILKDKIGDEGSKALVNALEEISDKVKGDLATKADIAMVKADLEMVRADLEKRLSETKSDILKWMFIFWASQIGLIVTLVKLVR